MASRSRVNMLHVLIYAAALTPFFLFSGVEAMLGEKLRQVWQIGGLGLLVLLLLRQNEIQLDRFTVCFSLYQAEVFVVTTLQEEFRSGILVTLLSVVCILLLIRNDRVNFLAAIMVIMIAVTALNLLTMVQLGTGGFDKKYFIGGKNRLSLVLVPAIFAIYLFFREQGKRSHWIAAGYALVAIASVMYGGSGTGIIVSMASMACLLFTERINIRKDIFFKVILALNLIILFSKGVFHSPLWIQLTDALGKDPTLTYRTTVWEGAAEIFRRHPIFGVGKIFEILFVDKYGDANYVWEAHNSVLQILCDGGIVGAALFFTAIWGAFAGLDEKNDQHKLVLVACIILMINGLTEVVNYNLFTIIFLALANAYAEDAREASAKIPRADGRSKQTKRGRM